MDPIEIQAVFLIISHPKHVIFLSYDFQEYIAALKIKDSLKCVSSVLSMLNVCKCASVCVCVIAVTRQDVENSAMHVARALERSTDGPQRGGMKERQKGGRMMRGKVRGDRYI